MNARYLASTLRLFCTAMLLCSVSGAFAAVRTVHVAGTVANVQSWAIKGYFPAMFVSPVSPPGPYVGVTLKQVMVDLKSGRFEGEIECPVVRNAYGHWVDIHVVSAAVTFGVWAEMVIRVPHGRIIDLGTFDWKPSHYRWKDGALVIDTAVPRDTVIGDRFGNHVRISSINPAPGDSMRFEFVWENSGQPHQASMGGFYMKDCCTVLCDFSFAVRTDTDVFGESWPHLVKLYLRPDSAGPYRLRQIPVHDQQLRDIDFLLDRDLYFRVGERVEP